MRRGGDVVTTRRRLESGRRTKRAAAGRGRGMVKSYPYWTLHLASKARFTQKDSKRLHA